MGMSGFNLRLHLFRHISHFPLINNFVCNIICIAQFKFHQTVFIYMCVTFKFSFHLNIISSYFFQFARFYKFNILRKQHIYRNIQFLRRCIATKHCHHRHRCYCHLSQSAVHIALFHNLYHPPLIILYLQSYKTNAEKCPFASDLFQF